jgi:hypothetical protein
MYVQQEISKKKLCKKIMSLFSILAFWKPLKKREPELDPFQNVTKTEHCLWLTAGAVIKIFISQLPSVSFASPSEVDPYNRGRFRLRIVG